MWLDRLVGATRERVREGYYDRRPEQAPDEPAPSLADSLRDSRPAIVAEIKPARPDGTTYEADVDRQAQRYAEGGAAGISVLTDPDHFDGSLANLERARRTGLPVLMKDFLVDPRQIEAARAWGSSAVLAIARLPREGYTDYTLQQACEDAREAGIEVLAEVVTEAELETALEAGADAIGVNVRDLDTLETQPDLARKLLTGHRLPVPALQLSDVSTREDVETALEAGAAGALVGSHLMAADDPEKRVRALTGGNP